MQKKRLSSIDREFMSSLRKYDEYPLQKKMNVQKKEMQIQEQQILLQDIQANVQDLEDGNYQKGFTSINLMFTDPNYLLRKHITFQLFVPEEKDFVGFTILNRKELWILLLLYFDMINQNKNQYARYLWQSIVRKMTEYLNYELREEVINKVKIYREKSQLINNQCKNTNRYSNQYFLEEEQNSQIQSENDSKINSNEICFDKSYVATLSDNSMNDRSLVLEQNIIIFQDQVDSATYEDVSNQDHNNNSSLDLNGDLIEITYHNQNSNDFQLPDTSFQQQSQTEDMTKNSIDQASNQVEVSLIAQMEQLGLQDNQQCDQLNNAIIEDDDSEIQERYSSLEIDQISQTSIENINVQESSLYRQNFLEDNKLTEFLKQNNIDIKHKPIFVQDFDKINIESFSHSDQLCKQSCFIGESYQSANEFQKNQVQEEEQKGNDEMLFKNYQEQLANDQAKQILKEDLENLVNDSDEDQIETKQQDYQKRKSLSKIEQSDIINIEIIESKEKDNQQQKTIDDYFKPKRQQVQQEDIVVQTNQIDKRRKSRISKIMQKSNGKSLVDIGVEQDLYSLQPSKQHILEESQNCLSQQLSNNKKGRSNHFDKKYDQNFMDKHGSGYRFEIQKAPKRLKEKYQVEEMLVPKRSSKRLQYPERSDLEISKMIIANNEILNYFTPADRYSQQISEEINGRAKKITYYNSQNKNDKNQIIVLENNQEYFINDIVEVEIIISNINDNESHHITKIVSGQLTSQVAIAQMKRQISEQIIFEDYNFYNNYLHYHIKQQQAIYLPLGTYLINQN